MSRTVQFNRSEPSPGPAPGSGRPSSLVTLLLTLARDIIRDRERVGWSQAELARRAGIRVETLNRIETGKHTPSVATIEKIDAALRKETEPKRGRDFRM